MKKMVWNNVLLNRCPKCGDTLIKKNAGFRCIGSEQVPQTCRFFITHDAREILVAKLIKKPL